MSTKTINTAQQQAIAHVDGPLLIVAGAGTGKTTVITEKIAHIIKSGLARPEEILALTFTDKAAEEMVERVDALLDIGYSELTISTFHTFCQRLIEEYGLDIGISSDPKLITDTESWLLMRQHIYDFNLTYYRPLGSPYKHIYALLTHFSKCKDELISAQEYLSYAEQLQKDMTGDMNEEEPSRVQELANAYHKYNQLLLDKGMLDFGDLIFYAVKLLQERTSIQHALQKKYKYILVDEFQDVNWAQYVLVRLLTKENQLTVVGDDDQSIYAFRGASVSNILRFKEDFPTAKSIVLNENYRSTQTILDTAHTSISHNNPDRLEVKLHINKKLVAHKAEEQTSVHHIHCYTLDDEVQAVIQQINRLKKEKANTTWDDFCVLVRANNHAESFINGFESAGMPYEFLASAGLYRQPIVLDAINFLKLLDDYHDHSAIYRLLRAPIFGTNEHDIQTFVRLAKKKSITYYEALQKAQELQLSQKGIEICHKIVNLIQTGIKRSVYEKPSTVLYFFFEESGYLAYLAKEEDKGNRSVIRQIYQLKEFFELLRRYEEMIPGATVHDFIEHYEHMRESGDEGKLYQPEDTPDSINIMTVHASKGLEFKYVFIVNLVEERFPARRRGGDIDIPIELIHEQLPEGDAHYQEERRLFYVAVTRAKEQVFFISSEDYGGTRKKKISRFLSELGYGDKGKNSSHAMKTLTESATTMSTKKSREEIASDGITYEPPKAYSFSQIKTYQKCPYQYKLMHILKIPTKGSAAFSFGSTIHNTLQSFYEKIQQLNSAKQSSLFDTFQEKSQPTIMNSSVVVPTLVELISMYERHWIGDWYKDKKQREQYYKKGKEILTLFYRSHEGNWTIPVTLEGWFKIVIGDHLVHGRIDRIDKQEEGTLEIIDYKTGTGKEKLEAEDKEQLLIYQIAAQTLPEYRNIGEVGKLTFYYIQDDIKTSFIGKEKEIEKLKEKLMNTIQEIKQGNFLATPNHMVCKYCDYRDICEYRSV